MVAVGDCDDMREPHGRKTGSVNGIKIASQFKQNLDAPRDI